MSRGLREEGTDWTSQGCGGIYTTRTELLAHCVSASRLESQCLDQPSVSVKFKSPRPLSTHISALGIESNCLMVSLAEALQPALIMNKQRKIRPQISCFSSWSVVESQLDEPFVAAVERENAGILKVGERLDWLVLLG